MKRNTRLFAAAAAAILTGMVFSCSKSGGGSNSGTTTGNGSGKDSILLNIGNNIILSAYQSLSVSVNSLDSAITDFNASPNSTKLSNVQSLFKSAYIAWESVSEYNYFGPASTTQPVLSGINIFPTSTTQIDANISTNNNNVNTFANTAAKGFPALDYLLFGAGGSTLVNYTTDAEAANRKTYLAAVATDIRTEVTTVLTAWSASGGNYINTFLSGTGTSVSSSLGLLINSLDEDFEILKNDRLGVPLGKIPVGTTSPVLPKEVEAYYSGISAQLALAQLRTVQGIFLGTAGQGNGLGLITYLINAKAKYNGGLLSDTIKAAFTLAVSNLQAVPDPLSQTIQANPAGADAAFAQIQQLVALLKTDMPSSLGVLITYGDNDGD
jgi:predicted lipoprotein